MNTVAHVRRNAQRLRLLATAPFMFALSLLLTQMACDGGKTNTQEGDTTANIAFGAPDTNITQSGALAANAVKVEVTPVRLARGGSVDSVVRVVIAPGFHVNANPATHPYLIPTALSVRSGNEMGVTAGAPVYPEGVTHKFAFDQTPLRVYEGAAEIKLPLKAMSDAVAGGRAIPLRVRVQPCDDAVCHPPRTLEATLAVIVE